MKRLVSLDILRGLDLFFLVFLQPVAVAAGRVADRPWLNAILYQLDHEVWEGFRAWDLVMPLFLFMVGTSMPFALAKYGRDMASRRQAYKRVIRRFGLLFIFGMIVQGNLLAFDPSQLLIYNNTLQAIAVGYLCAAMLVLHCRMRTQIIITVLLLIIYWIPMRWCGDYTMEGSFAYAVDQAVIGKFRGDLSYTWIWSSLTFTVTVMSGVFAGYIMKSASPASRSRAAMIMTVIGFALTGTGLMWGYVEPIIKRIWSTSMTLYSAGLCYLMMALFYYVIDCRGFSRGLGWLKIYGMNPITAYVLGEVINFRSIVSSVSYGLAPLLGEYWNVWLTFGNFVILYLILLLMYKQKVFIKV